MPVTTFKPLNSLLIKPSGPDCNLDCTYCFYLKKATLYPDSRVHRMGESVLYALIDQMIEGESLSINFCWQGGEPTLMGLDFFRKAVARQQAKVRPGQSIHNSLQTNGILLNDEWGDFLAEHRFLVGLSIDGPEHIHDQYRRTLGQEPTWERVMKSARMLLRHDVDTNALCVVNDVSSQHPEELYEFNKSIGLRHMQFIPCIETLPGRPREVAAHTVVPEVYGEFLCRMFDLWLKDFKNGEPTTFVRWFDAVFATHVGISPPECTLLEECGAYLTVEHNGDVYSCDFFVDADARINNVLHGDLLEMLNSPQQNEFGRKKKPTAPECRVCDYLEHCQGGCPKERLGDPNNVSYLCKAYKMFFEHSAPHYKKLAERWLRMNANAPMQMQL